MSGIRQIDKEHCPNQIVISSAAITQVSLKSLLDLFKGYISVSPITDRRQPGSASARRGATQRSLHF